MREFISLVENTVLHSNILNRRPSSEASERFWTEAYDLIEDTVRAYKASTEPRMEWKVVPAARLTRIWKTAAQQNMVRDERGLDAIADQFYSNVKQLWVNTEIAEHGPQSKEDILGEYFDTEEEMTEFVDWCIETEKGWRISDYGLEPLIRYATLLDDCHTAEEKLMVCDAILSVTHQRSDLASWFVEGGTATMDDLFLN